MAFRGGLFVFFAFHDPSVVPLLSLSILAAVAFVVGAITILLELRGALALVVSPFRTALWAAFFAAEAIVDHFVGATSG
jgi:hypothetical protein